MTNIPNLASTEQKSASPANPQQAQGNPQKDNQQQNQGGNKPSADKPASQPQQK